MDNLQQLKKTLEEICKIIEWHPSNEALIRIKKDLQKSAKKGYLTENEVLDAVTNNVPNILCTAFEGIDQSDIKSLLSIALKLTRN